MRGELAETVFIAGALCAGAVVGHGLLGPELYEDKRATAAAAAAG